MLQLKDECVIAMATSLVDNYRHFIRNSHDGNFWECNQCDGKSDRHATEDSPIHHQADCAVLVAINLLKKST